MLALQDDSILVADPQVIGRESMLFRGNAMEGFFSANGTMFQFPTRILETDASIRLNKEKIVHGVRLSIPATIQRGQRRTIYRTSLVCDEPVLAVLRRVSSVEPIQCPIDQPPLNGKIIDASAQGFGVNIPNVYASQFKQYEAMFITFLITGSPKTMSFLVEVRQVREISTIGAVRLGMLMLPWPTQRLFTREVQPLLRALNELERAQRRSA